MRQDLKHRLVTWKSDVHAGEIKKVYAVSESPAKKGELIIKLEKAMRGTFSVKIIKK